jgi:membrane-bound ClpP family serine protease
MKRPTEQPRSRLWARLLLVASLATLLISTWGANNHSALASPAPTPTGAPEQDEPATEPHPARMPRHFRARALPRMLRPPRTNNPRADRDRSNADHSPPRPVPDRTVRTGVQKLAYTSTDQPRRAAIIPLRTEISDVTFESLSRRIEEARAQEVDVIVFDLNTPGGLVTSMIDIRAAHPRSGRYSHRCLDQPRRVFRRGCRRHFL